MSARRAASAPRSAVASASVGGGASPPPRRGGRAPRRMRVRAATLLVSAAVAVALFPPVARLPRLHRRKDDAVEDLASADEVLPAAAAAGRGGGPSASVGSVDDGVGAAGTGGEPPAAVAAPASAASAAAAAEGPAPESAARTAVGRGGATTGGAAKERASASIPAASGTTTSAKSGGAGATANRTAAKLTAAPGRTAVGGNGASIVDAAPAPLAAGAWNGTAARASSLPTAAGGDGNGHEEGRPGGDGEGRLRPGGRFPRYGTPEYARRCRWLVDAVESKPPSSGNCTFYYGWRNSRQSEGMSFWITQIVSTHLLALQAGCKVLFDYGKARIGHVLEAPGDPRLYDWTVPRGYVCEDDPHCHQIPGWRLDKKATRPFAMGNGTASLRLLAPVPRYRYSYGIERFRRSDNFTVPLERALPGFDVRDGMACSLGALMTLAPAAARYQPDLFTDVLPALRDEEALVIGIYARTGWADIHSPNNVDRATSRRKGFLTDNDTATEETERALRADVERVVNATLAIERRFLTRSSETQGRREFRRIVWMVATDWPDAKGRIAAKYDGADANAALAPDERRYPAESVPRRVLTTRSRGTHTRRNASPRTSDFAFAFLDWYLLGESDLVVKWRYSFAETAALRTAADVYQGSRYKPLLAGRCTKVVVYDVDGSTEDVDPRPGPGGREEQCGEKEVLVKLGPQHKNPRAF